MNYVIDTDTLIDFIWDYSKTRARIATLIEEGADVALCAVTVAELYSGLSEEKRTRWNEWLGSLPYWDISRETARQAGIARKKASDAGRTYSVSDSLVAALAREKHATVLTSNLKDYTPEETQVLSLREKAA